MRTDAQPKAAGDAGRRGSLDFALDSAYRIHSQNRREAEHSSLHRVAAVAVSGEGVEGLSDAVVAEAQLLVSADAVLVLAHRGVMASVRQGKEESKAKAGVVDGEGEDEAPLEVLMLAARGTTEGLPLRPADPSALDSAPGEASVEEHRLPITVSGSPWGLLVVRRHRALLIEEREWLERLAELFGLALANRPMAGAPSVGPSDVGGDVGSAANGQAGRNGGDGEDGRRPSTGPRRAPSFQASNDPLTGLSMLTAFNDQLSAQCRRLGALAEHGGRPPLSLVLIDIDHFDEVTGLYGKEVGDEVLKGVSQMLLSQARSSDLLARLGERRLAWAMPDTDIVRGRLAGERLRQQIAAHCFSRNLTVTASLGLADTAAGLDPVDLLRRTEAALQRSQDDGHNRVSLDVPHLAESAEARGAEVKDAALKNLVTRGGVTGEGALEGAEGDKQTPVGSLEDAALVGPAEPTGTTETIWERSAEGEHTGETAPSGWAVEGAEAGGVEAGGVEDEGLGARAIESQAAGDSLARRRMLYALARTVDAIDPYHHQHSEQVSALAGVLAGAHGWPEERVRLLEEAARLHDVGKVSVPTALLTATAPLDPDQLEIVRGHAWVGAQMAEGALSAEQVLWVRGHHERWDGRGYPDGLRGSQIPEGAQLISLADTWDVIIAPRAYTPATDALVAMAEIRRCAGSQFDPVLVALLEELLLEGRVPRRRGLRRS